MIDEDRGRARAIEYTRRNLESMENLFSEVSIAASVDNSSKDAPRVVVEAEVVVRIS